MSVEAFSRRPSKVPPATKAKPKKDRNYEEHSYQQKDRSYPEHSYQQKDRSYEEHYPPQRATPDSSYEDCYHQKSPGNVTREAESGGEGANDFSKMIAMAAARRKEKACSPSTHDWSANQKQRQFPMAKQNETPQQTPSKLALTSSLSAGQSPLPPTPPMRNSMQSATLPRSGSMAVAKSFIQPQALQSALTSVHQRTPAPLQPSHASSPAPAPLPKFQPPAPTPHDLQARFPRPASEPQQQLIPEDNDEIYDDVESVVTKVPSPLPPPDTKQSQPFGSSSGGNPPTVPSTPRPLLGHLQRANSHLINRPPLSLSDSGNTQPSGGTRNSIDGASLSNPMSMSEFVSKYHDELPVKLKVQDVPQGTEGLRKGDVLNVHFSKTTRVAVVSDSSKAQYIVPFNSAVRFGIIFNPLGNTTAATQGYKFPTVGDITSLGSLPPVICAHASYEVSAADSSVQKNDILIVKEVKSHRRGRSLICIDARSKLKKKLLEPCSGNFSTSPHDVSLHVPDVVANIPLPQQCIVCYNGPNSPEITSLLPKGYVVIRSTAVNKTVVASREGNNMPVTDMLKQSSQYLMEIPATLDATVQVVSTADSVSKQLLQDSCDIYQKISTANYGITLRYLLPSENQHQLTFLSTIRHDKPHVGVTLARPTRATSSVQHSSSAPNLTEEEEAADDEYDIPQVAMQNYLDKQQSVTPSHYDAPRRASIASTTDSISSDVYDVPGNNAPLLPTPQVAPSPSISPSPSMVMLSSLSQLPSMVPKSQGTSESPGLSQEVKDIRRVMERMEKDFANLRQETGKHACMCDTATKVICVKVAYRNSFFCLINFHAKIFS